jgi:hypothetical protein
MSQLLDTQLPHKEPLWLANIGKVLNEDWEAPLDAILRDTAHHTRSGHIRTWPKNRTERRIASHTLGLHHQSQRSSSPSYALEVEEEEEEEEEGDDA